MCHARHLGGALGIKIECYPYPALPFKNNNKKTETDKIYIGVLGGGRKDKGYSLLPHIISKFNVLYPDNNVMFIIQEARPEDRLSIETGLLREINNVTLLNNELARSDYENYFLKCDITLFPYNTNVYECRGSGIINEALANGKPIICSEGTALTEALTEDNGISAGAVNEFANSIIRMLKHLDQYRENAKNARDRYLQELYNNPVIKNIKYSELMHNTSK